MAAATDALLEGIAFPEGERPYPAAPLNLTDCGRTWCAPTHLRIGDLSVPVLHARPEKAASPVG